MSTILNEECLTFKSLEQLIFNYACSWCRETLKFFLESMDRKLMKTRDKKKYRHKGLKENHIRCSFGDVAYRRVVYEVINDEGVAEYIHLLDEALHMEHIGKISMNLVESMIHLAAKTSFRNSAEELNRNTHANISAQGLWNVFQKFGNNLQKEDRNLITNHKAGVVNGSKVAEIIFTEMDGVYLSCQGESRPKKGGTREMKIATIYEGWNEAGGLVGKVMVADCCEPKKFQSLVEAKTRSIYNVDEAKLRVLNGDGAAWIKKTEDKDIVFQLDPFHIQQKINQCVFHKKMRGELKKLYAACEADKLIETVQVYADSIATDDPKDTNYEKALELLTYLKKNRDGIIPYNKRSDVEVPEPPKGMVYRNMGVQENQNCSNITMRMKRRKASWSENGAINMMKVLAHIVNKDVREAIARFRDVIDIKVDEEIVTEIMSAAQAPKFDGKGNKTGNVHVGRIVYRDSDMTLSRKAFLSMFEDKSFSEMRYH